MNLTIRRFSQRLFYCLISLLLTTQIARATGPATTTVTDVVYRADGSAASGTLLISWPAFVTADAVAAKDVVDSSKFEEGLSKVIDGVVECLNASSWAKK